MAVFNEPTKWAQALGATANADVIPDEAGAMDVDLSKIFPAVFSVPLSQGGKAIPRRTLNGIFKTLGDWSFYGQNGGVPSYNANFDYTVGRFVSYSGRLYRCIQDNVHTAPHNPTDKDYWAELLDNSQSAGLLPNQIITSPVPLTDANLHLLDGSLLTSGVYADYVAMMIRLYNADPTASCWISEADWQTSVSTYGECGKFVVDTVNETVRLPKLTSFIQATSTASALGSLTEAGLPNITGTIVFNGDRNNLQGVSGAFYGVGNSIHWSALSSESSSIFNSEINLDASRSSSVYGKSNTVQPQSVKYYYYIVVGTVSKTTVQVDIDNIVTDLNSKADTDFANITNTAQIAMAHNAMPSNQYEQLTFGASGTTYTAPADGFFTVVGGVNGGYIQLSDVSNNFTNIKWCSGRGNLYIALPIQKGHLMRIQYENIDQGSITFYYAVGSESEQQ